MKRSDYVALGAVGVIGAAFLLSETSETVSPPSDPVEKALIYASVDECIKAEVIDRASCEREFKTASDQHVAVAPKYTSQTECENSYGSGRCTSTLWNGASVFVPVLSGAMIANYLASNRNAQPLMPAIAGRGQPCPPGQTPQTVPGCVPQQSWTGSTSGGGGSSSWRGFSTARGDSFFTDSSTTASRGVASVPGGSTIRPQTRYSYGTPTAPVRSSFSSSGSVSRSGFGSSSRSFFSSSS